MQNVYMVNSWDSPTSIFDQPNQQISPSTIHPSKHYFECVRHMLAYRYSVRFGLHLSHSQLSERNKSSEINKSVTVTFPATNGINAQLE